MAFAALTIDLNAQLAKFEQDMKRASTQLDSFGSKASAAAAGLKTAFGVLTAGIGVTGLAAFAKQGIDAADALNDLSARVGVSVKDLASFKLAAQLADTSLENVGAGIARLSRSIGEAERGNRTVAESLAELGVTARDPKEAFLQLADGVERIADPVRRATLLNSVLGKSYQELLPLLSQGGDELRRMARESESFAETMARLAPDAAKFNDELDVLKQNAAEAGATLLSGLVPALNEFFKRVKLVKGLLEEGGLFNTIAIAGGESDIAGVLENLRKEIELTQQAIDRKRELGRDPGAFEQRLRELQAQQRLLLESTVADIQAPPQTEAMRKLKEERARDMKDTINYGASVQEALRKAFASTPMDDFLEKFRDRRKSIRAEYAALRAELAGEGAGLASSLDVSSQLTIGRAALEAGNAEAAQAAITQAKSLFKNLAAQEGTTGFEESYFLRELERLETDTVNSAEATADRVRETLQQKLGQLDNEAAKLSFDVDAAGIVAQVKGAVEQLKKDLSADPLRIPVVGVPSISQDGRQSVDLSTAALRYGARR